MENLLKIPYKVFNDWDLLQQFLERRGDPRYELVGNVNLNYREDIFDLGNLVRVDGSLILDHTLIQSLGVLEYVGINLGLYKTKIKSFENLEYVDGSLDLRGTPIQSLGNLQYVGEEIWLLNYHQIPEEQLTNFKSHNWYY